MARVGLVIFRAETARGGAERYTAQIGRELAGRGHTVTVLASEFGDDWPGELHRVQLPARGWSRTARYRRFLDSLDVHLSGSTYDIVHAMLPVRCCDVYHPHAGLAAQQITGGHRKYGDPFRRAVAWGLNQVNRKRLAFYDVERQLLESARPPIVVSLSDYVGATIVASYPKLPRSRVMKLFNAVDLSRFDPQRDPSARQRIRTQHNLGDDDVIALFIGEDMFRKGMPYAADAVARVNDPRLKLMVVGGDVPTKVQAAKLRPKVCFVGRVDDPYPYYAAADCFILPTRHDPCSLVVLEALAMGLPVISTRFNGACEIMDQRHGFVLDRPEDRTGLIKALHTMLDVRKRSEMSQACRSLRPELSMQRHLDRLEDIYQSGLSGR